MTDISWNTWESAPKDGTPFAVASILAFHPKTGQLYGLYRDAKTMEVFWAPKIILEPSLWTEIPPTDKVSVLEGIAAWKAEFKL